MEPPQAEPIPRQLLPLVVVLDANVFAHNDWMRRIVDAARNDHLRLFWSPSIIAEASRVLAWLWLKRRGGDLSEPAKRDLSDLAHRWFRVMSTVFEVVDDKPPHEPLWASTPRDEEDIPIWTAAVRAMAHCVVTENLEDGPPRDEEGLHRYRGITYVHPADFVGVLDWWGNVYETGRHQPHETDEVAEAPGAVPHRPDRVVARPVSAEAFLAELGRRAHEQHDAEG